MSLPLEGEENKESNFILSYVMRGASNSRLPFYERLIKRVVKEKMRFCWNWSALLFPIEWLTYRRLYFYGAILWIFFPFLMGLSLVMKFFSPINWIFAGWASYFYIGWIRKNQNSLGKLPDSFSAVDKFSTLFVALFSLGINVVFKLGEDQIISQRSGVLVMLPLWGSVFLYLLARAFHQKSFLKKQSLSQVEK